MSQNGIAGVVRWPLHALNSSCGVVNSRFSVRVPVCHGIAFAALGPLRNACLLRTMTVVLDGGATGSSGRHDA